MPVMRSCSRSTEESTKRAVPWLPISSPSTCHGSMAKRSSSSMRIDIDRAEMGETEFEERLEPLQLEGIAGPLQVGDHLLHVLADKMRQQEAVVQLGPPAHQLMRIRLVPEPGDQGAQQQILHQAHAGVRRHLEGAQLDQAEAPGGAVGGVELVDAELGAMRVAGHVDEQIAQQAIDQPGRRHLALAASAGRRSPVHTGRRCAPRRCAAPGWSGRRTSRRRGRRAPDGAASR